MMALLVVAGLVAALLCLADWRRGVFVCVLVGFLADPVRKLMPGQPVAMTAIVAVFVLVTIGGALSRGLGLSLSSVYAAHPMLRHPFQCFIVLVMIYAGVAYANTGILIVPIIGLLAYLSIFPALLVGFSFGQRPGDVVRWLRFYLWVCLAMGSGIALSLAGFQNRILEQVGGGLTIFSPSGALLNLRAGFFRAPEVAGWHMTTALCITLILFMARGRRTRVNFALAAMIVLALLTGILFTGRRKYLLEVLMFVLTYAVLTGYFRRSALKPVSLLVLIGGAAVGVTAYLPGTGFLPTVAPYVERGISAQQGILDRVRGVTVDAAQFIVLQNGYLGSGAGTGSQGVEHFVGGEGLIGNAAEGGFGKILAELGVPGLLVFGWVLFAVARSLLRVLRFTRKADETAAHLCLALVALLAAQVPLYGTAHQIFGDVFVLLILGWLCGFVLAMPLARRGAVGVPSRARAPVGMVHGPSGRLVFRREGT